MTVNHVAEQVFSFLGLIFWSFQLIPQIIKSHKSKSTEGLATYMILLWIIGGAFYGIYAILVNLSVFLIAQPQLFDLFCFVTFGQCLYYGNGVKRGKAVLWCLVFMSILAGLQVGLVYACRASLAAGNDWVLLVMGILPAVIIAIGLFPQYWEIYKTKQVVGISITFLQVDIWGGIFSIISLCFRPQFDYLAMATYLAVIILDGGIVMIKVAYDLQLWREERQKRRQDEEMRIEAKEIAARSAESPRDLALPTFDSETVVGDEIPKSKA